METAVNTNVIKRNGEEVKFDLSKIENAIFAANKEVDRSMYVTDIRESLPVNRTQPITEYFP